MEEPSRLKKPLPKNKDHNRAHPGMMIQTQPASLLVISVILPLKISSEICLNLAELLGRSESPLTKTEEQEDLLILTLKVMNLFRKLSKRLEPKLMAEPLELTTLAESLEEAQEEEAEAVIVVVAVAAIAAVEAAIVVVAVVATAAVAATAAAAEEAMVAAVEAVIVEAVIVAVEDKSSEDN
jgi:hypothetical protein